MPTSVKQPMKKGRQWRHFRVECPDVVAGLFGPANWARPSVINPASVLGLAGATTAPSAADDVGDTSEDAIGGDDDEYQDNDTTEHLQASCRVAFAAIAGRPGLSGLSAVLGEPPDSSTEMANTKVKSVVFECGALDFKHDVRGAAIFRGAPSYSFMRYRSAEGTRAGEWSIWSSALSPVRIAQAW